MLRSITSFFLLSICFLPVTSTLNAQDHGVKVPPGFKVTLYADHTLANDIYAMTLDNEGRVVVSSRGWVKRLQDTDGDGKADRASAILTTASGAMGLCDGGNEFLVTSDGWLSCAKILDPTHPISLVQGRIIPLRFGEHGGHAMRKGPDGCWYVIGGNDSGLANVKLDPLSPIKNPEAGGILRFSKDMKKVECIAQGFRNPYDFDFTPLGDIITFDSDTERDFLLPWYSPTRIYHVATGMHHGWRLPGYMQSLARRDYYPDTVDILAPIGRGSPTGVVCYRHYQFPKRYHGGVFALDWTFGKIWFVPSETDGSSYKTKPEVFLEPIGDNGFAPTDACVAPDGSLFVSIGGRGTRGAVYRIEYVGTKEEPGEKWDEVAFEKKKKLDYVLDFPQPLDAWARDEWEHVARALGSDVFHTVFPDETESAARRIRAIEVLVDQFNGIGRTTADKAAATTNWQVRARIAWALGRNSNFGGELILLKLAEDEHPRVRVEALNTIEVRMHEERYWLYAYERRMVFRWSERVAVNRVILANLAHADKRVRLAASRLVSRLDADPWRQLMDAEAQAGPRTRLSLAIIDHQSQDRPLALSSQKKAVALKALQSADPQMRLDALRLLMLMDGDWCLQNPPQVVYSAYTLQKPRKEVYESDLAIRTELRRMYPTGDIRFDHEAARYFAMIEDDDPETVRKVLARVTKDSPARDDVHHLIALARFKSKRDAAQTAAIVDALLNLEKKWQGYQRQVKQTWAARLQEVVADLVKKHPDMPDAILKHPEFVHPSHVVFTTTFDAERRKQAARLFLDAVKKDADYFWSPELVELLVTLPPGECKPLFRKRWSDLSLRDAMLKQLVITPDNDDRRRFLEGLESVQRGIVIECLAALSKLRRDSSPEHAVPILRRLQFELIDGKDAEIRNQLIALLNWQMGTDFADLDVILAEPRTLHKDPDRLRRAYKVVFEWFETKYPKEAKLLRTGEEDSGHWQKQLSAAPWNKGDASRGAKLFQQRSCAACHTGSSRIGADLSGTANRFSRDDLFTAILYPSRDVAPAFRVNEIDTQDGKHFSGIVVFESADGVIVQLDAVNTVRHRQRQHRFAPARQEIAHAQRPAQGAQTRGPRRSVCLSPVAEMILFTFSARLLSACAKRKRIARHHSHAEDADYHRQLPHAGACDRLPAFAQCRGACRARLPRHRRRQRVERWFD